MTPRSLADTGYRSTAESELTKYIRKRALGELIEYTGETTVNVSKMTRIFVLQKEEIEAGIYSLLAFTCILETFLAEARKYNK